MVFLLIEHEEEAGAASLSVSLSFNNNACKPDELMTAVALIVWPNYPAYNLAIGVVGHGEPKHVYGVATGGSSWLLTLGVQVECNFPLSLNFKVISHPSVGSPLSMRARRRHSSNRCPSHSSHRAHLITTF